MAQLRKRKQGEEEGKGVFGTLLHWVSSWYVLLIFCIFPFYVHNKLFDVLETRFGFFWKSTLLFSGQRFCSGCCSCGRKGEGCLFRDGAGWISAFF